MINLFKIKSKRKYNIIKKLKYIILYLTILYF